MNNKQTKISSFCRRFKVIYLLYILTLISATVYSYSLIDLNLTLFNHPLWDKFRNIIIQIGYFNRDKSFLIYLILITALFFLSKTLIKKQVNPIKLALIIGLITLFAYPFLSHDFFNYLFDAKILTFYHKNPYLYKALDFPNDPWIRFMHWTHRTYPYGPIFLLISAVPSFFAFGKFILSFLFFKLTFFLFYFTSVYLLNKLNKNQAILLAANPLIIIEGLINLHNDLIALSLAIGGIYYLSKNKNILGRIFLFISAGIKYITFPLIFLKNEKNNKLNFLILIACLSVLAVLSIKNEVQPWYFLSVFAFLPVFEKLISRLNIFFFGLLMSYYPYIRLGGWDTVGKIQLKHVIILVFLSANVIYLIFIFLRKKFLIK